MRLGLLGLTCVPTLCLFLWDQDAWLLVQILIPTIFLHLPLPAQRQTATPIDFLIPKHLFLLRFRKSCLWSHDGMGTFTDAQMQGKWEEGRQRRRCGLTPPVGSCVLCNSQPVGGESPGGPWTRTVLITPTSRAWGFNTPAHFLPAPCPGPRFPAQQIRGTSAPLVLLVLLQYY